MIKLVFPSPAWILPLTALELAVSACATEPALPPEEEALAAAASAIGGDGCPPAKVFAPGVVATSADENRLVFSPDGRTAWFHRYFEADNRLAVLRSERRGGTWTTPVEESFTSAYNDSDPFVTLDGARMYFCSDRPIDGSNQGEARPDWDIWYVDRTKSGWGPPVRLGPEINTDANELFPTTTLDGTLYFNSDREGGFGAWDIWKARRRGAGFHPVENLGPGVNTEAWEFNPAVSPLGHVIFFGTLGRPDTLGGTDIYASVRAGSDWLPSWNVGPCVNTAVNEYHPSINLARGSLGFIRFTPETLGEPFELPLAP
jgi:Tol biopolymer transport system component